MRTSRKLTHLLMALFALVIMSAAAFAADPGVLYPATSEASDQKAGSLLFYNIYTSSASGTTENTRINITNTSTTQAAFVHLFFVARECGVADSFICLTATQTASFLTSDVDPVTSGYIVAVADDGVTGCPVAFNHLIGDLYVKFSTGHAANLGAVAFAALYPGGKDSDGNVIKAPGCTDASITAELRLNGRVSAGPPAVAPPGGVSDPASGATYNQLPRVLALSNIPSAADGNDTLLIVNRVGGNLATGTNTTVGLFGLLYDDAENVFSFTLGTSNCQLRGTLGSANFPRTTPRFGTIIPAGRSGWMKLYNVNADVGYLGAMINFNAGATTAAGAFSGGHNLHHLTLSSANTLIVPIFPPSC